MVYKTPQARMGQAEAGLVEMQSTAADNTE